MSWRRRSHCWKPDSAGAPGAAHCAFYRLDEVSARAASLTLHFARPNAHSVEGLGAAEQPDGAATAAPAPRRVSQSIWLLCANPACRQFTG